MNKKPAILSIATQVPAHIVEQETLAEKMAAACILDEERSKWLHALYKRSKISRRYSVLEDFSKEQVDWHFWKNAPSTKERNDRFKIEAPKLAHDVANQALKAWGKPHSEITHLICVSCTGIMTPGLQAILQSSLNLKVDVNQLAITMMGCFGAFKALDVAAAYAMQDPLHRILIVCTELCTLHFQQTDDVEQLVGNALFADGAAACIVGCQPDKTEPALWIIEKSKSMIVEETRDKMSWDLSDNGLLFGLKREVPSLIGNYIERFAKSLLPHTISCSECLWPVHPGGKQILEQVEQALHLTKNQTESSWHVLNHYGNMSSPTFLFVLDHMKTKMNQFSWAVGLGFGPGLCFEGILLKKANLAAEHVC